MDYVVCITLATSSTSNSLREFHIQLSPWVQHLTLFINFTSKSLHEFNIFINFISRSLHKFHIGNCAHPFSPSMLLQVLVSEHVFSIGKLSLLISMFVIRKTKLYYLLMNICFQFSFGKCLCWSFCLWSIKQNHSFYSHSVHFNIAAALPADGGPWRTEHSSDNLWQEEQDPSLLLVLAQIQNSEKWHGLCFLLT